MAGTVKSARGAVGRCSLLAVLALLVPSCSRALFFPSPTLRISPAEIGLAYRDVEFASSDGTALHGWFLPAQRIDPGATVPTVVFFHGNAGNVSTHLGGVLWLPAEGFHVFLFDYRGFGHSAGDPDLVSAHRDAVAALRVAAALPEVDSERIVVVGQSLGGAIALDVVAALGEEIPVRALVVDSAPNDFRGIAREKLGAFWLTWALQAPLSWTIPADPSPRAGAKAIAAAGTTALLIISGDRDEIVPVRHAFALSTAAPGAELLLVPGAGHIEAFDRTWVRRHVTEFLWRALPPTPIERAAAAEDRSLRANRRSRAIHSPSRDGSPPTRGPLAFGTEAPASAGSARRETR